MTNPISARLRAMIPSGRALTVSERFDVTETAIQAADHIDAQAAKIKAEYERGFNDGCAHIKEDYKAGGRIEARAQDAKVAALVEALRPFADFGSLKGMDLMPDNHPITSGSIMAAKQVTVGDFRKAVSALAAAKETT